MLKKIIHIDMDYFFAQVEELKNPSLKNVPVGIGSPSGRGVLCTSNYEARKYGVKSAMPTGLALRKCPHLVLVRPCFDDYKKISKKVFEIFYDYSHVVEGLSLDEAYLDVSNCKKFDNSAFLIAREIRKRVLEETGLTCSAGISYNKFFAKLACEVNKPDGQFLIPPNVSQDFIGQIEVKKISGVGKVFEETLSRHNIYKLKDIIPYSKEDLLRLFGKFGAKLYDYARGIDTREVQAHRVRKSLSVESTFYEDLNSLDEINEKLKKIYENFRYRLSKVEGKSISTIFVKIKYHDFVSTTIERQYTSLDLINYQNLFEERFSERRDAVRLIGLGVKFRGNCTISQLPLPFCEV